MLTMEEWKQMIEPDMKTIRVEYFAPEKKAKIYIDGTLFSEFIVPDTSVAVVEAKCDVHTWRSSVTRL